MQPLPHNLYRAEGVRALDRTAIDTFGAAGGTLMNRAGGAAFEVLRQSWPAARAIGVLCGAGNNAGDGYVVARLAHQAGRSVTLIQVGAPARLKGDARDAASDAETAGVPAVAYEGQSLAGYDLLVDALLGTGVSGEVEGRFRDAIDAVNASGAPVLALDLPSGLDADTGAVLGTAVRAEATLTFIGLKQGLFTGEAPAYCGRLLFDDLQVSPGVYDHVAASAERLDLAALAPLLAPRAATAHKGAFGHVLVVGGERGMAGAPRLAGEAAARTGAGLVSLATRAEHAAVAAATRPELMAQPVEEPAELAPLLGRATVLAVGPGLGTAEWGQKMLARALESRLPLVVDADGLNLLAADPLHRDDWVLTPHPGEAARLLGTDTAAVQRDRFAAAAALRERFGGVCILKGAGTIIADGGLPAVSDAGNPGMASGGMGDLLTGILAGLLAQGLAAGEAARLGVALHGAAGDAAAALRGERGLLARDLLPHLRERLNPVGG